MSKFDEADMEKTNLIKLVFYMKTDNPASNHLQHFAIFKGACKVQRTGSSAKHFHDVLLCNQEDDAI
jgi:hypothetical protein